MRPSLYFNVLWLFVAVLAGTSQALSAAGPVIDADYPGGNIKVIKAEEGQFLVAPDQRDTSQGQWWFYFNFRLRAPAGQPVTVVFTEKNPLGVRGPAVSTDGGIQWKWLGASAVKAFQYAGKKAWKFEAVVPAGAAEVRYAFAPPYLEAHWQTWLAPHRDHPALRVETLCQSRRQRPVELVRVGCLDPAKARGVVLLTSRHHCCESMATYSLEGLLESVLADDSLGRLWRERWEIVAVPFMDKDGVEAGDQGKFRAPHDHNRDYNEQPLYPEVAALMRLGGQLKPRLLAFMDMHCPYISGRWNDRAYFVGSTSARFSEKQKAFAAVLERVRTGPIPFDAKQGFLPSGVDWNTPSNFSQGRSSSAWARDTFTEAPLVTTIEIAYADALGAEVNAVSARALGRDLAMALADYLAALP